MQKDNSSFKELVWDLMNGSLNLEEFPVFKISVVKDEFSECS